MKTCNLEMTSENFSVEAIIVHSYHLSGKLLLGRNSVAKRVRELSGSLRCGSSEVRS